MRLRAIMAAVAGSLVTVAVAAPDALALRTVSSVQQISEGARVTYADGSSSILPPSEYAKWKGTIQARSDAYRTSTGPPPRPVTAVAQAEVRAATASQRLGWQSIAETLGKSPAKLGLGAVGGLLLGNYAVWSHNYGYFKQVFEGETPSPEPGTTTGGWSSFTADPVDSGTVMSSGPDDGTGHPVQQTAPVDGFALTTNNYVTDDNYNYFQGSANGATVTGLPHLPFTPLYTTCSVCQAKRAKLFQGRGDLKPYSGTAPTPSVGQGPTNGVAGAATGSPALSDSAEDAALDGGLSGPLGANTAAAVTKDLADSGAQTDTGGDPLAEDVTVDLSACTSTAACRAALEDAGVAAENITVRTLNWQAAVETLPAEAPAEVEWGDGAHEFTLPSPARVTLTPGELEELFRISQNPEEDDMPTRVPGFHEGSDDPDAPDEDPDGPDDDDCDEIRRWRDEIENALRDDTFEQQLADAGGGGTEGFSPEIDFIEKVLGGGDLLQEYKQHLDQNFPRKPPASPEWPEDKVLDLMENACLDEQSPNAKNLPLSAYLAALAAAGIAATVHYVGPEDVPSENFTDPGWGTFPGPDGPPGSGPGGGTADPPGVVRPGDVVRTRPKPGTKVRRSPNPGRKPDGSPKGRPGSQVDVDVLDPQTRKNPDGTAEGTPKDVDGVSPPPSPPRPGVDFGPLNRLTPCDKFPFGVPCWAADMAVAWFSTDAGSPPNFKLTFPMVDDADRPTVDLVMWEDFMPLLRGLVYAIFVVTLAWRFMALTTNRGGGGDED